MNTMDEEQQRAYANLFYYRQAIGPRAEYYLEQFEKFERAGDRWVATWNWPAFFSSSAWFAYRRMSGRSLLNFFLPILFIVTFYVLIQSELRYLVIVEIRVPIIGANFRFGAPFDVDLRDREMRRSAH